jgi:hypothetical protein
LAINETKLMVRTCWWLLFDEWKPPLFICGCADALADVVRS